MDIHDLFEANYSEHNGIRIEVIRGCRLSNGSYNNLSIARAFRMFKAGFEANQGEKMRVIGFIDQKDADSPPIDDMVFLSADQGMPEPVPVYVKQCDPLKLEMKHEKQ